MTALRDAKSDSKPKEKREFLDIIGDIAMFLVGGILVLAVLELLGVITLIPG